MSMTRISLMVPAKMLEVYTLRSKQTRIPRGELMRLALDAWNGPYTPVYQPPKWEEEPDEYSMEDF